jgi:hypothetical protein
MPLLFFRAYIRREMSLCRFLLLLKEVKLGFIFCSFHGGERDEDRTTLESY